MKPSVASFAAGAVATLVTATACTSEKTDLAPSVAAPPRPSAAAPASAAASARAEQGAGASSAAATVAPVRLRWLAEQVPGTPRVRVSLRVNDELHRLGEIDATSDDEGSGTPAACSVSDERRTATASRFGCGGTPAYHFFTATLRDGALVVTSTRGLDQQPGSEKTTEVARIPAKGAALAVRRYRAPNVDARAKRARATSCPAGSFLAEGECMKECASDADCRDGEQCQAFHLSDDGGRIGPVAGMTCE